MNKSSIFSQNRSTNPVRLQAPLPNLEVIDQHENKYRFYDELIKHRVVLINFMSTQQHILNPVSNCLASIADRLGAQLGRSIYIYSITTDPEYDNVKRLQQFSRKYSKASDSNRPGWHFLTAPRSGIQVLTRRLLKHYQQFPDAGGRLQNPLAQLYYGNEQADLWGAINVDCRPEFAIARLLWIKNGICTHYPASANSSVLNRIA